MTFNIEFEPVGRRGICQNGKSLLEDARYLGVGLVSICGGFGKCRACKVRILKGSVSEPTTTEIDFYSPQQIKDGWRLACLTYPESDCTIHVPPESLTTFQRMQVESHNIPTVASAAVQSYRIKMTEPDFLDLRSDSTRVLDALKKEHGITCNMVDVEVLRAISLNLRNSKWKTTAFVRNNEVLSLNPAGQGLGLAVDVGTTKIAGYLLDIETGKTLASKGIMNPQISYGEDITSRIHHALKSDESAVLLQKALINGINGLAADLCAETGVDALDIVDAVIVGNTAIHHLFLKLPVYPLCYPPFNAAVQEGLDIKARDTGLKLAPGAYVHVMPNIAGFVGADHVSMLVAIDALNNLDLTLAIDIGTNTEVSLISNGSIFSASCASGPAFEGGQISCGMRAATGAIERMRIEAGKIQFKTINDAIPVGICGSGIIDSIAQLYDAGILDDSGRMKGDHAGVRETAGVKEFVLYAGNGENPDIVITQKDVREVQLGKGAIRAGIQILLEKAGAREEDIKQVYIAGAFGTYIDVANAILLGMLPDLPLERFKQVGNAAGLGARQSLISVKKRELEDAIAKKMNYIELAGTASFNKTFLQTQYLGKYRIMNGKRIKL
ncbi:MAG TPA: ASKHA domain-containing protein [Dehalococcoidales bacterium]|nr:ASKHA domain-containing protein [Dehalococcoidales bacterium]